MWREPGFILKRIHRKSGPGSRAQSQQSGSGSSPPLNREHSARSPEENPPAAASPLPAEAAWSPGLRGGSPGLLGFALGDGWRRKTPRNPTNKPQEKRSRSGSGPGPGGSHGGVEGDPSTRWFRAGSRSMAPGGLVAACRSLALSTWLLSFCFVHLLCLDFTVAEREEWYTAFVNITYVDPATSELRTDRTECGRYGEHSPKRDAKGAVVLPAAPHDRQACDPNTRFTSPRFPGPAQPGQPAAWIALIARGNCTYKDKIRNAAAHNASAVVIFNVGSANLNDTITMPHPGTGEVVAIMIPEPKGREVALLLEHNVTVTMTISIGTRNLQKYVSRTSVVFVSISFIVLMIISLAWLVFYYIQRFRYANARDRNQRRLGDAAKKAISKLQVRSIRRGDEETEPDFDNCAVCIEGYRPNDVVRVLPCRHLFHKSCVDPWLLDHRTCPMCKMNILKALGIALNADCLDDLPLDYDLVLGGAGGAGGGGVGGAGGVGALALEAVVSGASSDGTLSEGGSSVVLDPGVRRVGLPQDYQDPDSLRDSPVTATTDTHTGEHQPMASSASVASLVIAVETGLSDEEGSMEHSQLGNKS